MNWNRKILVLMVLAIGWITVSCDALPVFGGDQNQLTSSGVVEAVEVSVAPEISARVVEVFVDEGAVVQKGDDLIRLEDTLLQERRRQALAALDSARANLNTAETGLAAAEANLNTAQSNLESVKAESQVELIVAQQSLDELYDTVEVARSQALNQVSEANRAVREAQYRLDNFTVPNEQQEMGTMEALKVMKARLDQARLAFEPYKYRPSGDQDRKDYKEDLDQAQSDYDAALRRLEYETDLKKAQAQLDQAMEDLAALENGPDPQDIEVLEARIAAIQASPNRAEAAVQQAQVGLEQAQAVLEQAQATIQQAQVDLDLINAQLAKSFVDSPTDGVILSRNIEPGEVVQAGLPVITVGQLDQLSITVYVPENRYGQINLGDQVAVTSDSFPGQVFDATVVRIADRAEYTPRNVQTQEDRATTVFAIKLQVTDSQGKLKPGMPVDVKFTFSQDVEVRLQFGQVYAS